MSNFGDDEPLEDEFDEDEVENGTGEARPGASEARKESQPSRANEGEYPRGEDDDSFGDDGGSEEQDDETESGPREVVVPGQVIGNKAQDCLSGYGTIMDPQGNIISLYIGFIQHRGKYINVIPFKGRYMPHVGDKVIGKVVDKNVVLWKLDINAPTQAILKPMDAGEDNRFNRRNDRGNRGAPPQMRKRFDRGGKKEDTSQYNVGDMVIAKVLRFDRMTEPALTTVGPDLGSIKGGFLTEISVPKIPRLIGKGGSMIRLLNSLTSCKVFVAQNGIVWLKGRNVEEERTILKAVKKIEVEAHTTGLTDRIKEFVTTELRK